MFANPSDEHINEMHFKYVGKLEESLDKLQDQDACDSVAQGKKR